VRKTSSSLTSCWAVPSVHVAAFFIGLDYECDQFNLTNYNVVYRSMPATHYQC
jgi:hypothetical protein